MPRIEDRIASITEDRRADYLFDTELVAKHLGIHRNRFNDRWQRTKLWLIELYLIQPGELAAEFASLIALAEARRKKMLTEDSK